MLEVKEITKNFGGLRALDGLSFTVGEAEIVGLIGPNGSGKSTAFNLITGALPVSSGKIYFDTEDITRLLPHQVARRGLGRTFQLVRPFLHLSVLDNITAGVLFGPGRVRGRAESEKEAYEILEQVGLEKKANEKADDLTVVERKWLEIGRSLAGKPKLLLLDEFMAGLSSAEIPRALDLIRSLKTRGISVIVVEHIVKAITGACERVIVLNAGKKLAEGSVDEVISNPSVIKAYLGTRHANGR